MNNIRLISFVYALLQMLAMLVLLVAGKKAQCETLSQLLDTHAALGRCGLGVAGGCDWTQMAYVAHQEHYSEPHPEYLDQCNGNTDPCGFDLLR